MKKYSLKVIVLLFIPTLLFRISAYAGDVKKYVFKINGKVTYKNISVNKNVGVYGAKVVLHMLKKGNGEIDQPIGSGLNPKDLQVSLKPDGSFSFDLEFFANMAMFDRIFLEIFPVEDHGGVYNRESPNFITSASEGTLKVLDYGSEQQPFTGVELKFDEKETVHEHKDLKIELTETMGAALRYLKISHECAKYFYQQIGKNISIPPLTIILDTHFTKSENLSQNAVAVFWYKAPTSVKLPKIFCGAPRIYVRSYVGQVEHTVSHEYGHFIHYLLNNEHFQHASLIDSSAIQNLHFLIEGVAEFLAMVARAYAYSVYNDDLMPSNNLEKLPFDEPPFQECSYCVVPPIPQYASYLWNLYDGPSLTYSIAGAAGKDNDDIDGPKEKIINQIFNKIITTPKKNFNIKNFFNQFKTTVDIDVAVSMDHMSKFLLGESDHAMLPAQINNAKLTIYDRKEHILITESHSHYTGEVNYKNLPLGYKLYGKKGNSWVLIKNLAWKNSEKNSYFIPNKDVEDYEKFKITAYNESGQSLHPYEFENGTLPITLEGPKDVFADISYQWKAKVTGGIEPIVYNWKMRKVDSDKYFEKQQSGSSPYFTSRAPEGESFILEVLAVDKNSSSAYTEIQVNTATKPLKPTILGLPFIAANMTGSWQAEVSGGVPPYTYYWTKKVEGLPALISLGQSNSCSTKSDKPFVLKLLVKDSKGTSAIIEKPIQLNILAPIAATINGAKLVYLHENTSSWQVEVTGGEPPYTISWSRKYNDELTFFTLGEGPSYQKNYGGKEGIFYLKATVKDKNGSTKESPLFKVTALYQPLYTALLNDNVELKQGENIVWNANISGGKPPYRCRWEIGKDINHLSLIKDEMIGYEFHPTCFYKTPFINVGKYLLVLTVEDALNKSITIQKDFLVKDKDIIMSPMNSGIGNLLQEEKSFAYYPNPAKNEINTSFILDKDAFVSISLISMKDHRTTTVHQQAYRKGRHDTSCDISGIPEGIYILQLTKSYTKEETSSEIEKILIDR